MSPDSIWARSGARGETVCSRKRKTSYHSSPTSSNVGLLLRYHECMVGTLHPNPLNRTCRFVRRNLGRPKSCQVGVTEGEDHVPIPFHPGHHGSPATVVGVSYEREFRHSQES